MAKAKIKVEGMQELKEEFTRLGKSLSRTIAHYTADQLTEQANRVLADYYADYDPIEYSRYNYEHPGERTFQLLNSAKRYYNGNNHLVCEGGVRFAYETLYYPNKGADPLKTTQSFWDGSHGGWCDMKSYVPGQAMRKYGRRLVNDICHGSVGKGLIAEAVSSANLSLLNIA